MEERAFFTQTPTMPDAEATGFRIPAEVHTDDLRHCVAFDAAGAFEDRDDAKVMEWAQNLNAIEWGGNYSADHVAYAVEDKPGYAPVADLFGYLTGDPKPRQLNGDPVGFEVEIDAAAALRWINENAPAVWSDILKDPAFEDVLEEKLGIEPQSAEADSAPSPRG